MNASMNKTRLRRTAMHVLRRTMTDRRHSVLALVRNDPGVTSSEIGRTLGIGQQRAWQVLQLLVRDGHVEEVAKRPGGAHVRYRPSRRSGSCPCCGGPFGSADGNGSEDRKARRVGSRIN